MYRTVTEFTQLTEQLIGIRLSEKVVLQSIRDMGGKLWKLDGRYVVDESFFVANFSKVATLAEGLQEDSTEIRVIGHIRKNLVLAELRKIALNPPTGTDTDTYFDTLRENINKALKDYNQSMIPFTNDSLKAYLESADIAKAARQRKKDYKGICCYLRYSKGGSGMCSTYAYQR